MSEQGRKVVSKEREVQRREQKIEDGLPNPHWGNQNIKDHAANQTDFDGVSLAQDESSDDEFVQSDQYRQEEPMRCYKLCEEGFVKRHKWSGRPFCIK